MPQIDMTRELRYQTSQCRSGSGSLSQRSVDGILGPEPDRFRLELAIDLDPVAVLQLSCESHGSRGASRGACPVGGAPTPEDPPLMELATDTLSASRGGAVNLSLQRLQRL